MLGLLLALCAPLSAQDDPKFLLKASLEPAKAAPGAEVTLVLSATTAQGWHAYGTLETGNIPVSLDAAALQLTGLERNGEVDIPAGMPDVSPYGTTFPLPESFRVTVPLKVAAGATGKLEVSGGLGYQICMQGSCEQPNTAAFVATGEVAAAAPASSAAVQEPPPPIPVPGLGTVPGLMLEGDEKVTVTAKFEPATARAGELTTLVLDVNVIDGWHAYGTKETGQIPVEYAQDKQDVGSLEFEGDAVVPPGDPVEVFDSIQYQLPHHFEVRQAFGCPPAPSRATSRSAACSTTRSATRSAVIRRRRRSTRRR